MRRINLENEYNNRQRVANYADIAGRWQRASEAYRSRIGESAELDIAYGDGDRQAYDLFWPEADRDTAPVIVYIHGGYWQRGDRKDYSIVAENFVNAGCIVAVPSYSLCPDVTVMGIVAEMISFVTALHAKLKRRPLIVGHSAGGHLASALIATDWSAHGDVPEDLVQQAYAISGVFNLRPLIRTSINDALNLERDNADEASTALWPTPAKGRRLVAAVGAMESREFIRQSIELTARWGEAGAQTECILVPDSNHFTILDQLMTPGSGTHQRVLEMALSSPLMPIETAAADTSAVSAPAQVDATEADAVQVDAVEEDATEADPAAAHAKASTEAEAPADATTVTAADDQPAIDDTATSTSDAEADGNPDGKDAAA